MAMKHVGALQINHLLLNLARFAGVPLVAENYIIVFSMTMKRSDVVPPERICFFFLSRWPLNHLACGSVHVILGFLLEHSCSFGW